MNIIISDNIVIIWLLFGFVDLIISIASQNFGFIGLALGMMTCALTLHFCGKKTI